MFHVNPLGLLIESLYEQELFKYDKETYDEGDRSSSDINPLHREMEYPELDEIRITEKDKQH